MATDATEEASGYTLIWPGDVDLAEFDDVLAIPMTIAPMDDRWMRPHDSVAVDAATEMVRHNRPFSQAVLMVCDPPLPDTDPAAALRRLQSALKPGAVASVVLDDEVEHKLYGKRGVPSGTDVLLTNGLKREIKRLSEARHAGEATDPSFIDFAP